MDLQIIHNYFDFFSNKELGSFFTPDEKDKALDFAQMKRFKELIELYAATGTTHEALQPLKTEQTFVNGTSPGGLLTFNSNFEHLIAVETSVVDGGSTIYPPVPVVSEDEISYRRSSQLIPLSTMNPCGLMKSGKTFQIYPASAIAGTIYYFKRPTKPIFIYSQAGRVITYNIGSSTQMDFNDTELINKIIPGALSLLGLNVLSAEIINYAETKSQQTKP